MTTALETVQLIYAAFGRGDIPAILAHLDDDVKWEAWAHNSAQAAGVPWMRGGAGKAAAADFFGIVGTFRFNDFQVLGMMAGDRQVAVECQVDFHLPDGGHLRDEELHLWNLNTRGLVVRFRHYLDTAKHIALLPR